ncbi:MAG: hypothetical protein GTO24_08265 [candidate division Zixibacteria bacterium]|nr:hypothetical protein [candidate division Zixibacteria bacterium]
MEMKILAPILLFFILFPCSGFAEPKIYGSILESKESSTGESELVKIDQSAVVIIMFQDDGEGYITTVSPGDAVFEVGGLKKFEGKKFKVKVNYKGKTAKLPKGYKLLKKPLKFDLVWEEKDGKPSLRKAN